MSEHAAIVTANAAFAAARPAGALPMPPARHTAVVVCMDARILPSHVLGLKEGCV
jgi:carbonic anhydrase